jgi:phenylpropionate dioxygenase-like ring-hydroxylating dioxygenase large terminal subunit
MEKLKALVDDRSYLRHFWHPVCTLKQLEQSNPEGLGPIGIQLLDERIVIVKLDGKIVAMRDRCAHRFTKLSGGKVIGKRLRCPYHGWEYDAEGKCRLIPACPNDAIPKKAVTPTYDCAVKYDLAWVRPDSSWNCTSVPYCGAWDNPDFRRIIVAEPYDWASSPERRWENFTDFSHFAYVHPGTLYDPAYSEPAIVPMDRVDGELRFYMEPGKDMLNSLPPDSPLGSWNYRAAMPFSINLDIRLYRNGSPFLLWTTSSPMTAQTCRSFMIIAHADPDLDDSVPLNFQKIVLAEDKPVVETQLPDLSLEEVSLPTDKVSNQYRKWLRELSMASIQGQEAFRKALLSNVMESA